MKTKLYKRFAKVGLAPEVAKAGEKLDAGMNHRQRGRFRRLVETALAQLGNAQHPVHGIVAPALAAARAAFAPKPRSDHGRR